MREIKFRAWSLQGLRFWYFDIHTGFNSENSDCFPIVEQFTGLKDKNGVDIYEGDLLRCGDDKYIMHVIWSEHKQGWISDIMPTRSLSSSIFFRERAMKEAVKVIGNIHENKELLK